MTISLSANSRLRFGELLLLEGVECWDILDLPVIPTHDDDLTYTVGTNDRLDKIAYDTYGDPTLWWVIAVANGLELVPTEVYLGRKLRLPSPTYVTQVLFSKAKT
jgi:nucleoid-associated protein YgaU